ncbi:putative cop9 signalosome complex subunit [Schistosoma mansoni]|uniref:putative cop9 signalosome complex subunit n=1 Tax=Schistosoma mansoni TaxID=6183 RepID=UPI00022DC70C|nr:putative cop9 signalosome complex subunit [Schistosoma mansoni]|eukprot:XP_018653040.1 putative cop9 signalosome complex subunit [Schistosoma mansoni]
MLHLDPALFEDVPPSSNASTEYETVDDEVQIDLGNYISNYQGYIYYQRLFFIAQRCPSLRVIALRLAHDYVKKSTLDSSAYNKIFLMLAEQTNFSVADSSASSETSRQQQQSAFSMRLITNNHLSDGLSLSSPSELGILGSSLTEASRNILTDVMSGKLQLHAFKKCIYIITERSQFGLRRKMGGVYKAERCYASGAVRYRIEKSQSEFNQRKHTVAIFQRAWSHVSAHVTRASSLSELRDTAPLLGANAAELNAQQRSRTEALARLGTTRTTTAGISGESSTRGSSSLIDPSSRISSRHPGDSIGGHVPTSGGQSYRDALAQARTQLAIAAGLVELASRNYRGAAMNFLQVNHDHCESPTSRIVTISDLAFFITLCSLATFERTELATLVLGNASLRLLLEAEPACRDILQSFHQADYASCLGRLNKLRNVLRLDIFLSDHVSALFREIRSRALCQYFSPYSSADLNLMAKAFDTNVASLENELAVLIQDGSIKARIDSHKQLLRVLDVDQRCLTFARAVRLVDEYKNRTHSLILRMALARQKLTVKSTRDDIDPMYHYMS